MKKPPTAATPRRAARTAPAEEAGSGTWWYIYVFIINTRGIVNDKTRVSLREDDEGNRTEQPPASFSTRRESQKAGFLGAVSSLENSERSQRQTSVASARGNARRRARPPRTRIRALTPRARRSRVRSRDRDLASAPRRRRRRRSRRPRPLDSFPPRSRARSATTRWRPPHPPSAASAASPRRRAAPRSSPPPRERKRRRR